MKRVGFLIILLLFLSFSRLNAQNRFGIEGGALRSKVEMGGDTKLNSEPKTGYKLGVFAEFPIYKNFFFDPALSYVNKGGKFNNDWTVLGTVRNSKVRQTIHFVELPLNLLYKFNSGKITWLAGTGPVLGYGIAGKEKIETTEFSNGTSTRKNGTLDIKFDGKTNAYDSKMHLKPFEIGMNIFIGADLSSRLRAQLQFRPNFSDLAIDNSTYKNTYYYSLTFGFFF